MFKLKVDQEISLLLVHERFAARYAELARENYDYLAEWLAWPSFAKTEADFRKFALDSLHKYADGKGMNCAIEYRGEIIGNSGFNTIQSDLRTVEIGYWIGEKYQGNGIITRVCRFLIEYAFDELKMDKVQIASAVDNQPSRAVCERLNMNLEGIVTNRERVGDRILDHAIYGIHRNRE